MSDIIINPGTREQVALELLKLSFGYTETRTVDQMLTLYRQCYNAVVEPIITVPNVAHNLAYMADMGNDMQPMARNGA